MKGRRRKASSSAPVGAPAIIRNTPWHQCVEIEGPDGVLATLYQGDCVEIMQALEHESVHSVVTDPPYELGFMGKAWDKAGGVASDPTTWARACDLLKPGGHLVAFAGSRTYHRIAMAIEQSGLEIRDQIMWLYGSGFPKSLDVAKAIDASDAKSETPADVLKFTAWMRSTGITARQINEATGTFMASHYLTAASQPAVATSEHFDKLRPLLPKVPKWVERLVEDRSQRERAKSANLARREVVGQHEKEAQAARWRADFGQGKVAPAGAITRAFTPEAKQWEGWGTALKPAHEPIALARKRFHGTVAGCVLTHGTGALNIAGARVGDEGARAPTPLMDAGRWPPNVVTDGSVEVLEAFPVSARDAIRFFYAPKASKEDRDFGMHAAQLVEGQRRSNYHPTVKPTDLMRWLCRLTTPPAGVVLEPFLGSGSTGIAAIREGMRVVGIEQSAEYFDIARRRNQAAVDELARTPDLVRQVDRAVSKLRAEQFALTF